MTAIFDNIQWSTNLAWTCGGCGETISNGQLHVCGHWSCQSCGALVGNGQAHVCYNIPYQFPQQKPHKCPVCDGRGRVLFDPENPFKRGSSVQDWACKPCSGSGVLWAF